MARRMTAAWMAALGAMLMIMAAQPHSAAAQRPAAQKPKAQPAAKARAQKPAAAARATTTLTGCLRMDGYHYELTDLKGDQAPKARSWKTGFITKTTKDVEVIGASTNVRLNDHVGRQVTVVGMKDDDTHLKVSSVKRLSASCS